MTGQAEGMDWAAIAGRLRTIRATLIHTTTLAGVHLDAEALRRLCEEPGSPFVTRAVHERMVRGYQALATEEQESHKGRLREEITRADASLAQHARELAERLGERGWPTSVSGRYRREGWGAAVAALERIARDGARLAVVDPVPAEVDQAVRDTLALHQALNKLPHIYRTILDNPSHPAYRARCRIAAGNLAGMELPPDLHEARDTVLAALRQGGDR